MFGVPGWRNARFVLAVALLALLVAASLVIGSQLTSPAPKSEPGPSGPGGPDDHERAGPHRDPAGGWARPAGGRRRADQSTAELYDPTTGTFTRTGTMSTEQRFGMTAALLHDGRVLIVGGTDMMQGEDVTEWPLTFGEVFDPATRDIQPDGTDGPGTPGTCGRPSHCRTAAW